MEVYSMKKRAMKKWIPEGCYCSGTGTKKYPNCKWRKYCGTKKLNKDNCEFANECEGNCWTNPQNSCTHIIYKCEYMNFTDFNQDSLLWDGCKECGIKD